jgi:fatty acid desaturase
MRLRDTLRELTLPLPWLTLSLWIYSGAFWPLGALASFLFFLCALRLNHEAIHGNLGLSRRRDHIVLHLLSAVMLGSNHAVAHGHVMHHRHAMGPGDFEGKCGHMTAAQVLRYGPRFPIDLNLGAWAGSGSRGRRRIVIDWLLILTAVGLVIALPFTALKLHVAAMAVAQCLTAFFAVWITHHGTHHSGLAARSQRGWLARAAYLMFYHREHHLFPRVPVHRLPDLAARKPVVAMFDPGFRRARSALFARKRPSEAG